MIPDNCFDNNNSSNNFFNWAGEHSWFMMNSFKKTISWNNFWTRIPVSVKGSALPTLNSILPLCLNPDETLCFHTFRRAKRAGNFLGYSMPRTLIKPFVFIQSGARSAPGKHLVLASWNPYKALCLYNPAREARRGKSGIGVLNPL